MDALAVLEDPVPPRLPSSLPAAAVDLIFDYPGSPQRADVLETVALGRTNVLRAFDKILAVRPPVSAETRVQINAARVAMAGFTTVPASTCNGPSPVRRFDAALDKWILEKLIATQKLRVAGATVTLVVICEDGGDALMFRATTYASLNVPLRVFLALCGGGK